MKNTWLIMATIAIVATVPSLSVSASPQSPSKESFLKTVAQAQEAAILLGQLATQNASEDQVKQFGTSMIKDHQKARKEIEQLAFKAGVRLPMQLSNKQRHRQQELSQLSGKEFDRAYLQYMLREHDKEANEFEQHARALLDHDVKLWALDTLPVLKQHLDRARAIATSIGMELAQGD